MSTPNPTNQPQGQPGANNIPAPSAQGNQTPSAPPATPSVPPNGIAPLGENLPPDVQAIVNRAAAAARREGVEDGARAEQARIAAEQVAQEQARREREGEADERIAAATERANNAERERDSLRLELWRLRAALRAELPNPVENARRLQGTTEAELLEDARTFKAALGNVLPVPETPPATPAGGDTPPPAPPAPPANQPSGQQPTREQLKAAQRRSGGYQST